MSRAVDSRREAGDPATSPDLLRDLAELHLLDPIEGDDEAEDALFRAIADALCLNPSLPLDVLSQALRRGVPLAWLNPSVPPLLAGSLPTYHRAAWLTLRLLSPERHPDEPLEHLVLGWTPAWAALWEEGAVEGRPSKALAVAVARRIGSLFGVPWPEEP